MKYQIEKYIDITAVRGLMEYFYKITSIPYAFTDSNGNILCNIGRKDICADFHKKNKHTSERCYQNDTECRKMIKQNKKYTIYRCCNGLVEAFIPIYIDAAHVANLLVGQVLTESMDIDFFRNQAREFGFDEEKYIDALKQVPVISNRSLESHMDFGEHLAAVISSIMYGNYKASYAEEELKQHNQKLESLVAERTCELENKNNELREYIAEKEKSQNELIEINKKLNAEIIKRSYFEEELQNSNKKLAEEEERARRVLEAFPYAVCVRNGETILYSNNNAARIFGFSNAGDMIGLSINDLFMAHPSMKSRFLKKLKKISEHHDTPLDEEILINKVNGKTIYVETATADIIYNKQNATLVVFRDITYKKQLENKNKELNEILSYERLRTEFFSNISHEFRTPINIIYNAAKMGRITIKNNNDNSNEKLEGYLGMIEQNCFRLTKLVNNILDINKFDYNNMQLNLGKYNIVNIVENTVTLITDFAQNKNIDLIFDTQYEEIITMCDPDKIERVMLNLLSNAIKFTPADGEIFVDMSYRDDTIIISVKDTGIGIPEDKLNNIFEKFTQVDNSLARSYEGTGLGLYIVKSIVEMHQGNIKVESKLGQGSNFIIELPVKKPDSTKTDNVQIFNASSEMFDIEFSDIKKEQMA